jgi:four helix bundle protein
LTTFFKGGTSNYQIANYKQNLMSEISNNKHYDLEERTLQFAKDVRLFIRKLLKTVGNMEDGKQLVRSSGSIGANYIEANEALSKKDFLMRIKICRKEAKESRYWLRLLDISETLEKEKAKLLNESEELLKIFSAIANKSV